MKLIFSFYYNIIILIAPLLLLRGKQMQEPEETKWPAITENCRENVNCPPWGECINNKCMCREELDSYYSVKCDNETLQLSVLKCHCLTFDNETKQLFEGNCIENCENHNKEYLPLPMEINKLNEFMCGEKWNRTGRLCGTCLPGHSPLAYSYDMRCVKCPRGEQKCLEIHSGCIWPTDNILLLSLVSQDQCYLLTSPWLPHF